MSTPYRRVTRPNITGGTSRVPWSRRTSVVDPRKEILIAVLGVTGAGKSTFINRAIEREGFLDVGHSIFSCTKQVACVKTEIDGKIITLIDTPGFDDTNMSDGEVLSLIAIWLSEMYEAGMLLTGIILLQPVDGNRAYGSEARRTRLFRKICGTDVYDNVVIATTMWGKLINRSEGVRRVEERKASGDFWANLVNAGAKLEEHSDTTESAQRIIRMLLSNKKKPLALQEELADADGRLFDTSAAQQLFQDLGNASSTTAQEMNDIRQKMKTMQTDKQEYLEKIRLLELKLSTLKDQKQMLKQENVQIQKATIPEWIQALCAAGTVALGAAAIVVPFVASAGLLCNIIACYQVSKLQERYAQIRYNQLGDKLHCRSTK